VTALIDSLISEATAALQHVAGGLLSGGLNDVIGLFDDNYALIVRRSRSIGSIIPDVVVEERHEDALMITEHPVETGAAISDHAYKRPSRVEMRIGFSDSTAAAAGYVQQAYQELLALQAAREPFDVFTGKRAYSNMLIANLSVVTDRKSEWMLGALVTLQQVIIVGTGGFATVPAAAQKAPQTTAPVQKSGTKQIKPVETITV
jgi:hypothetical protein